MHELAQELIKEFEKCAKKMSDGMIAPYLDSKGVPTIGWGNTMWENGVRVTMKDQPITQVRADTLFDFYFQKFCDNVKKALKVPYDENELAAFCSLAYNIGASGFAGSTACKRFNANDKLGAMEALQWWNKEGPNLSRGLQIRRRAEAYIFAGLNNIKMAREHAEKDFPKK